MRGTLISLTDSVAPTPPKPQRFEKPSSPPLARSTLACEPKTVCPTWIVADPHVGERADRDALLLSTLEAAARRRVHLWLLGDLFVAWLGPERFWTTAQRPIMEALCRVRAAGGRVEFVVGNRDYLANAALHTAFDAVITQPTLVHLAGVPTWILHGDGIEPSDRGYRAWRAVSRSRPVTAVLRRLPSRLGQQLTEHTRRALAPAGQQHKSGILPLTALESVGRSAACAGAHRALLGHFHHDRTIDVAGGVPVIVAPGFTHLGRMLVVRGETLVSVPAERVRAD